MADVNIKMATLSQELKDLKTEVISRLIRIEEQTRKTNGTVAKVMTDIALGNQERKQIISNCDNNHPHKKEWTIFIATGISSVVTAIAIVIILKMMHLA
jgi:hypothetical protein